MNTRIILAATAAAILAAVSPLASQGPPGGPGGGGPSARDRAPLPLAAVRKATFTAKEATWMSLDVSPDGKTIVFDLLGDLTPSGT